MNSENNSEQLIRAEYADSYKKAGRDGNILDLAEEGMEDYAKQLES